MNESLVVKRTEKVVLSTLAPAAVVFVVSTAVSAIEPDGFEQTKLESGVTVADIEPLKDGRLLMVLDHDGELRGSFSHDDGKTWKACTPSMGVILWGASPLCFVPVLLLGVIIPDG